MRAQFWHHQFPALPKKALDPITDKFSTFINPLDTTGLISQIPDTKIHFPDILRQGKIFLANLSQGRLGLEGLHQPGGNICGRRRLFPLLPV